MGNRIGLNPSLRHPLGSQEQVGHLGRWGCTQRASAAQWPGVHEEDRHMNQNCLAHGFSWTGITRGFLGCRARGQGALRPQQRVASFGS